MYGQIQNLIGELRGEGRGWSLLTVAFGWSLVVGTMLTLPVLLPRITATFDISNAAAGGAVTVLWLVYGASQLPAGLITDRVGERRMLLASMVAGGLVVTWFTVVPTFTGFILACGFVGIVGGLYATPRVTLLSRIYPDRSGTAIGAVMAMGNVGAAVLPAGAGLVAATLGWRLGFGIGVPLFLLGIASVWLALPQDRPEDVGRTTHSMSELIPRLGQALQSRGILLVTAGVTLTFFTFQGLTAFLTTFLISAKGVNQGTAALMFGGLFTAAAITQPIAGRIADEVGDRVVLVAITGLYALLLFGFVESGEIFLVGILVVLLGIQRGATPVATSYLTKSLPENIRGSGYGLLRTIFTSVSSSAAFIVGLLADAGQLKDAFLLLAVLAVVATVCYLLLPRDAPERSAE